MATIDEARVILIRLPAAEGTVIRATVRRMADPHVPEFRLSGRVDPWPGGSAGRVRLRSTDTSMAMPEARVAGDGTFVFTGVPTGVYELWVEDRWWLAARVVVSDRAVSSVILQAGP